MLACVLMLSELRSLVGLIPLLHFFFSPPISREPLHLFPAFVSIFSSLYRASLFLRPLLSSSETKLMFLCCHNVSQSASLQL